MRVPNLYGLLSVGHLLAALRSLFATSRDDSVPLIMELLSLSACPAGVLLLLRLAAAGSLAASGASLALAHDAGTQQTLRGGLAAHAAVNLLAGRCSSSSALPRLRDAQPPAALHLASLTLCARDALATRWSDPAASAPPAVSPAEAKPPLSEIAFCLDIDGTLVLTDDIYFEAFKRLLKPYGYEVDDAFYQENVHGKVDADVFTRLMPAGSSEADLLAISKRKDELFCELYRAHAKKHGPPALPGLAEALTLAQEQGIRCVAVTNAPRGAADACIASLRETIPAASIIADGIVVGAECTHAKPHPEPYLEGMRRIGASPKKTIVFEDSGSGVRAGIAAGVRAVVGFRSCMSDAELRALGATTTLDDWNGVTRDFLEDLVANTAPTSAASVPRRVARVALDGAVMATLMLGAATSAVPGAAAEAALLCKGADKKLNAAAVRAYAASLMPLWALLVVAQSKDDVTAPRRIMAYSLLASCVVQAMALGADGHALYRWARRSILPPVLAAGAVGGWRAVKG